MAVGYYLASAFLFIAQLNIHTGTKIMFSKKNCRY